MERIFAQLLINIVFTTCLYLVVAASFTLIYYPTKIFHLAHAGVITIAPYLTYFFFNKVGLSWLIAALLSLPFAGIIGLLIEILVYRKMRDQKKPRWAILIASLGISIVIQNVIALIFGDDIKILAPTTKISVYNVLGATITQNQLIIIICSLILFGLIYLLQEQFSFGKIFKAVSSNENLSKIYGINTNRVIMTCFIIGSVIAGVSGIMFSTEANITPNLGFNLLLFGVIALIISGVGKIKYLFWGTLLVATAQHLAAYFIDTKWMDTTAYLVLILFLMGKPLGISGNLLRKIEI